jgi:predicted ATPase
MVVQNFLTVLATPEHPLVVFLDDLQWADTATLQLLLPLLTNPDFRSVFVIGAYRDHGRFIRKAASRSMTIVVAGHTIWT